jgi:hypothetical protein
VELRGFEPLTPSMRTLGGGVAWGRWRRSLVGGGLSEAFAADRVAVLVGCTALSRPLLSWGPGTIGCRDPHTSWLAEPQ